MILDNTGNNKPNTTERRSRITNPTPYSGLGKLPPQATDLEEAVLGALMLEREAMLEVADILKPEIFYRDCNQKIFSAIHRLLIQNKPVDILTVTAELRKAGELEMVGGAYYLTELTNRVASAANIEFHSRIIQQKFIQRELIRVSMETIEQAYEDTTDIFDLLSRNDFYRDEMLSTLSVKKEVTNSDLYDETKKQLEKFGLSPDGITGVPSGFIDLDKITGGWQRSDLIILAARPAMGKTSLALQCAVNAAICFDRPVAIFSLEMSSIQLMHKEISIISDVPLERIKKSLMDSEDWSRMVYLEQKIKLAKIHWDDTPGLNVLELGAKCRRLKAKHNIQLVVIDYLQLLHAVKDKGKQTNREQEIGYISRTLKGIAKDLDIPVIALSQLSRKVEERPGGLKRPMLSDLRESGSIEQDADVVLFLYRDEYYGITEDSNNRSTEGLAEVMIAKHRNGDTGEIILKFNKKTTGFGNDDYSDHTFQPAGYIDPTESVKEHLNPFTGLAPNNDFDIPKNFIIRPSKLDDDDTELPF